MRLFVANVGVNSSDASKRGMRSPLFDDGSFEMVPIKEGMRFASSARVRRYDALPSWTGKASSMAEFVPDRMRTYAAHDDPDFARMTYGDKLTGRAAALREARADDLLLFLARLWPVSNGSWERRGAFHFVGAMFVTHNLEFPGAAQPDVSLEVFQRVRMNAHVLRDPTARSEPYRVVVGDVAKSTRFRRPIPVTGKVAALLFAGEYSEAAGTFQRGGAPLRNKNGSARTLKWFGSITRAVQWFLDDANEEDRPYVRKLLTLIELAGRAEPPSGSRFRAPSR